MPLHTFLLTLGSNDPSADHITPACEALCEHLGAEALRFSTPRASAPISFGLSDAPFTDVVVLGQTSWTQEDLAQLLKRLELRAGRTLQQRQLCPEVIPVDIDLILWEGEVLKPKDLERPYLTAGLAELGVSDWRQLLLAQP